MLELELAQTQEAVLPIPSDTVARRIPIRVHAFDPGRVEFSEETFTCLVSHRGAHIELKNCVVMDDFLRIVNLEDLSEADFRILGPRKLALSATSEWVVECVDSRRNIWGLPVPRNTPDPEEGGPLLMCRACGTTSQVYVSPLD